MEIDKLIQSFLRKAKTPLIVILGATASGKTALSLKIAHLVNGEIISTDSRQLYKEVDISTDVIAPDQMENIPHHLLAITAIDKPLSLAEYKELAIQKIAEIYKRKHIPMLVGGTGLYISAIIEGYDVPRVPPDPKLRQKLEKEAAKKGNEYVHAKLKKLDKMAAEKIHPNNLRYVIRAIEINLATKENKSDTRKKTKFDVLKIGIEWPRNELYKRIGERVDSQIKRGLVNEVKNLLSKGYQHNLPAMSSLGVKELIPYLEGKLSLEECIDTLKSNTRHYAKRQMTWFRRYDNVFYVHAKKTTKKGKIK